jgi:malonyl-CoA O-methyltransferase
MTETSLRSVGNRVAIARGFGRAAPYYDAHADAQRRAAGRVADLLAARIDTVPAGPVLEVGCGTGFLTRHLVRLFPGRNLEITDLSEEMVAYCRGAVPRPPGGGRTTFWAADAEAVPATSGHAVIAAGFVAQWLTDPGGTLRRLAGGLRPGGLLAASAPVRGSFPEWARASEAMGLPFVPSSLPDAHEIVEALSRGGTLEVTAAEEDISESHEGPLAFFRHLKRMGAATRLTGGRLSAAQLTSLVRSWQDLRGGGEARVTYRVLFVLARRPSGRIVGFRDD